MVDFVDRGIDFLVKRGSSWKFFYPTKIIQLAMQRLAFRICSIYFHLQLLSISLFHQICFYTKIYHTNKPCLDIATINIPWDQQYTHTLSTNYTVSSVWTYTNPLGTLIFAGYTLQVTSKFSFMKNEKRNPFQTKKQHWQRFFLQPIYLYFRST